MRKLLIIIVVVLLVGAVAGRFALKSGMDKWKTKKQEENLTLVRVATPERGDLLERVSAPGEIEPRTKVSLSARTAARITDLPFEEGDVVKKDDVVVLLDSSELLSALQAVEARRSAQEAGIEVAEARIGSQRASIEGIVVTLNEAKRDLARNEELYATGDVARSVLDDLVQSVAELESRLKSSTESLRADELNLKVMEFNLAAATADIKQARDSLSYTTITSPIDGVITKINAEEGELVMTGTMNNAGTVIMEIADLDEMVLMAQVDEADIGGVEVGQDAEVLINAYSDRLYNGKIVTIALSHTRAGDGSKFFETEILLDTEGQRIYSGLTASVDIQTRRHEDVLMIPSQSVVAREVDSLPVEIRDESPDVDLTKTLATVVYTLEDGKAKVAPVTIGPTNLTHTVILSGINEDSQIITGPFKVLEGLHHDQEVKDERVAEAERLAKEREEAEKKDDEADSNDDTTPDTESSSSDDTSTDDEGN